MFLYFNLFKDTGNKPRCRQKWDWVHPIHLFWCRRLAKRPITLDDRDFLPPAHPPIGFLFVAKSTTTDKSVFLKILISLNKKFIFLSLISFQFTRNCWCALSLPFVFARRVHSHFEQQINLEQFKAFFFPFKSQNIKREFITLSIQPTFFSFGLY